jgi:UPF0271 protein
LFSTNLVKVIDANVIIHGRGFDEKALTVPEVKEEIKSSQASRKLETIDIKSQRPSEESLEKVEEKKDEIHADVSDVDVKILALALSKNKELLTDDKELQNLGLHLDVDVSGFMEKKTDSKLSWKKVCSHCGRESCSCGAEKVRKIDKKTGVED